MANPILILHKIADCVFDLTGLRTGSVRDQLLRASLLANCLRDEKAIFGSSELLVIGAGAAGMCAALTAAKRGVNVTVVEKEASPFFTFYSAAWREIDPVEYDWPHDHYNLGHFPISPGHFFLAQTRGTGANLASLWTIVWNDWLNRLDGKGGRGKITLLTNVNAKSIYGSRAYPKGVRDSIEVDGPFVSGNAKATKAFGAIIVAAGFESERTDDERTPDKWNNYKGPAFWTDDDGVTGRSFPLPYKNIVISGGGDGAMQDFQRVLTGCFGKSLLSELEKVATNLPRFDIYKFRDKMLAADSVGQRANAWQDSKKPAKVAIAQWHAEFEKIVDDLLRPLTTGDLMALASGLFRREFFNPDHPKVTWVYQDQTPGYAYALNRFLCLVLINIASKPPFDKFIQLYPHSYIDEIKPSYMTHQCSSATQCLKIPHDLTIKSHSVSNRPPIKISKADLIIVRHGAVSQSISGGAPVPQQMLPFDFPS